MLTVAYMTSRKENRIEWFRDSLSREVKDYQWPITIVIVDTNAEKLSIERCSARKVITTPPKPTVWQGPSRLTTVDHFAAANSRNTAICLAEDGWIIFVDDLSVLLPGWFNAILDAIKGNYIVLGAYKKVKHLVVEKGNVLSYEDYPPGTDSRWDYGKEGKPVTVEGGWLFGCSFAAPVSDLLEVGGFPEICDGMGYEDVFLGWALANAGKVQKYDRRMLTFESEELHFSPDNKVFKRFDPGQSPNDKSHAVLNMMKGGCKYFDNFYEGGLAAVRQKVLAGEPFPKRGIPEHCWFTGQRLSEL